MDYQAQLPGFESFDDEVTEKVACGVDGWECYACQVGCTCLFGQYRDYRHRLVFQPTR